MIYRLRIQIPALELIDTFSQLFVINLNCFTEDLKQKRNECIPPNSLCFISKSILPFFCPFKTSKAFTYEAKNANDLNQTADHCCLRRPLYEQGVCNYLELGS